MKLVAAATIPSESFNSWIVSRAAKATFAFPIFPMRIASPTFDRVVMRAADAHRRWPAAGLTTPTKLGDARCEVFCGRYGVMRNHSDTVPK